VLAAVNHLAMVVTLMSPLEMERQRASGKYRVRSSPTQRGAPYAIAARAAAVAVGPARNSPPWGSLVNIDLRTSRIAWQVRSARRKI